MSSLGLSDPGKPHRKASIHHHHHRRCGSGELDVFEASGYYNSPAFNSTQIKIIRGEEEPHPKGWRSERRISLDVPMKTPIQDHHHSSIHQHHHQTVQTQVLKEKKKNNKQHKQPNSPGGRLANFLNSLFNQSALKKNKKSSSSSKSVKDNCDNNTDDLNFSGGDGGRRKRRISISHFRSASAAADSSSSSSSISNPTRPTTTITKSYTNIIGNLRSHDDDSSSPYSDHKHIKSGGGGIINLKPSLTSSQMNPNPSSSCYSKRNRGFSWLDERFKLSSSANNNDGDKKCQKNFCNGVSEKERIWVDDYRSEEREFSKFGDGDGDGAEESDSSSDLFELENYDLGLYSSSGLPVYETTHMDSIKRAAATVSNAPM